MFRSVIRRRSQNHDSDLLERWHHANIPVAQSRRRDELLKSFIFVISPTNVVEVFVEHYDGSRPNPAGKTVKDGVGRRIKIAVDMQARRGRRYFIDEFLDHIGAPMGAKSAGGP